MGINAEECRCAGWKSCNTCLRGLDTRENVDFICPELKLAHPVPLPCETVFTLVTAQDKTQKPPLVCGTKTAKGSRIPSPQKMLAVTEMRPFLRG